jgi:hypothetical protein
MGKPFTFQVIDPDKFSVGEGARIADDIFAKNGNPAILMRVSRENLAGLLARVFELGRRYEREELKGGADAPSN